VLYVGCHDAPRQNNQVRSSATRTFGYVHPSRPRTFVVTSFSGPNAAALCDAVLIRYAMNCGSRRRPLCGE
jgi:hypothetical protein